MTDVNDIDPAPWMRSGWTGSLVSLDGTDASDFAREDVADVIAYGSTPSNDWDGRSVAIVRLSDGRVVAWETWWEPTGNGFCCDAYGGDTDIMFASDEATARRHLSERALELLP